MKLARYLHDGETLIGSVNGNSISRLTDRISGVGHEMTDLIRIWDESRGACEAASSNVDVTLEDVELLAPVARPGKIWGIGLNYADHVEESGVERPTQQTWFPMAQTSVAGPCQPIQLPRVSSSLDYEAEMAYVIGKGGRHISAENALSAVFGYCVGNDVSVRDFQFHSSQFSVGKSFDTHAPFGPWIVTADEVDATSLAIRCLVNGEERQSSNTKYLIFTVADQIEYLSKAMTLEPGDVFFTGTPGGVGVVQTPPKFLAAGDKVRVEIDGLGYIENEVVAEGAAG